MLVTALCNRRTIVLQIAASTDKAGLKWRGGHSSTANLLECVLDDKPQFTLVTDGYLNNPTLFTDLRVTSPNTLIIICLTPEVTIDTYMWATLDGLNFDMLCTLAELPECLTVAKESRFFHSSLLATQLTYIHTNTICGWNELTSTEKKILKIMAEGQTGPKLADQLFISLKTVNNHKHNISQKLGISGGTGSLTRFSLMNSKLIQQIPD